MRALRRWTAVLNEPSAVREVFVVRGANYNRKSSLREQALRAVIGSGLFAHHGKVWSTRPLAAPRA